MSVTKRIYRPFWLDGKPIRQNPDRLSNEQKQKLIAAHKRNQDARAADAPARTERQKRHHLLKRLQRANRAKSFSPNIRDRHRKVTLPEGYYAW